VYPPVPATLPAMTAATAVSAAGPGVTSHYVLFLFRPVLWSTVGSLWLQGDSRGVTLSARCECSDSNNPLAISGQPALSVQQSCKHAGELACVVGLIVCLPDLA
jgi:hypothetical protein